jgi:ribonucleoside-diphosphate reductase alpha chain
VIETIVKRSGETVTFDVSKIKQCISWASEGLEINPVQLESTVSTFPDGCSTEDIQNTLVLNAKNLASAQDPDWVYVAGRLASMNLWKEVEINRASPTYNRGSADYSYLQYLLEQTYEGRYDSGIFLLYDNCELEEAGKWIDFNYDLHYDFAGIEAWKQSYLVEGELPQEALLTISLLLASVETSDRLGWAKKFFIALRGRKLSLATPFLANLRRPSGNLSSCFIIGADDDLDSIMQTVWDAAKISKNGGGVGVNLSRLRSAGSWIRGNRGNAGGVIPFLQYFNVTASAVNQEGRRKGAITVSLDAWHRDVMDFLELRLENKDQRMTAHDIFPQLVVPDLLLKRFENKGEWWLVDPYEVEKKLGYKLAELWGESFESAYTEVELAAVEGKLELALKIPAKDIFIKVIQSYEQSGLPYITFKDTLNRYNPNKGSGYIPAFNLCVESASNVLPNKESHVCNLTSLNLANVESLNDLENSVSLGVRMLDNSIDLTESPIASTKTHNQKYRTIGLGQMGLADYLAKRQIQYGNSVECLEAVSSLSELIAYFSFETSMSLAESRGFFEAFPNSEFAKGKILCHDREWFEQNSEVPGLWMTLFDRLEAGGGIRNSQLMATAPNTSSALLQGCSPSFLPVRSKFYTHKKGNGFFPVVPPALKEAFWYYREAKQISPFEVIDVASSIQKWTDTGISMELLVDLNNPEVNAKYFRDMILHAWKQGCKAIYYIRFLQRTVEEHGCTSCG